MRQHYSLPEQEKIVGATFESFIRLCDGNKAIAALYFGQAYWNAKGIAKYNRAYDEKIHRLERKRNPKATDLAEAR